jgi:cyclic pyranopterin phosphate synthase
MRDSLSRIDYLRISVTDRCNLRCMYCMPSDGVALRAHEELLSLGEIVRLVELFSHKGVTKVRITGGEPLVRKDITGLISAINDIDLIEEVSLTTNGILLPEYSLLLKKAGLKGINISLDSLQREKFTRITGRDRLNEVFDGVEKARSAGFSPLKINVVLMKGVNEDEIIDFVLFAQSQGLILRFIEFMKITPLWSREYFFPIEQVMEICDRYFNLQKIEHIGSGPADYYKVGTARVGFIKTDENNCRACSRLRLLADGELKICLYEKEGLNLRDLLRRGESNDAIEAALEDRLAVKVKSAYKDWSSSRSYMYSVGG